MSEQVAAEASPAPATSPAAPSTAPDVAVTPPAPAVAEAQPTIDDTLEDTWERLHREPLERDETGRFVPKNGKAPDTEKTAQADQNSAVTPQAEKIEPATPAIDPPQSWTAEARASHWAKLPPEAQTYIAQRESEAHKAITSYGERLKSYEPLEQVITQFKDDFSRRGLQPAQAVAYLANAQRQLDQNPIDGLISIGLTYGIDLRPLLTGQTGSLPTPDPRVGQVEQRLNQIQQDFKRQQDTLEQQLQADADATLKEFAKDKPYFEDVRKLMSSFVKDGHTASLQDAYDMAVNASPQIRARIQADQRAADEKKRQADESKRQEEAKAKAAEAQRSAKVNVRSSSAHPNPKTMDDTLEETWRRLHG